MRRPLLLQSALHVREQAILAAPLLVWQIL
jgi:hypothetical protein